MTFRWWIFLIVISVLSPGCQGPTVPPEVKKVEIQENNLWRDESSIYAPNDYNKYRNAYKRALGELFKEKSKFAWFRSYKKIRADFSGLLVDGQRIEKLVRERKEARAVKVLTRLRNLESKVENLKDLTMKMNEGRYARTGLAKAGLALSAAAIAYRKGRYKNAMFELDQVEIHIKSCSRILKSFLDRYGSSTQVNRWQKWIRDTIRESKRKKIAAIIVNKIDRELIVYRNGKSIHTFKVGLGQNGLQDKRHAGDNATPEGQYHIIKKLPASNYYKALLIDYPNEEDKRIFSIARKRGLVPSRVGIGGLVEIHGGGIGFMTRGCVSLDNDDMDELFNLAQEGTPVTIVGSMNYPRHILSLLLDY